MKTKVVMIVAEVLEEREVKGTKFYSVRIKGKQNPIWVEESEIIETEDE